MVPADRSRRVARSTLLWSAQIGTYSDCHRASASQPRLELIYLPTYMGHKLNPTEKVWWDLKGTIAANCCFKTLAELDQFIQYYFNKITEADILRLINSAVVRQALLSQTV